MNAPSQWETTLQCNVVSHWLGAFTKWSLTWFIITGYYIITWHSDKYMPQIGLWFPKRYPCITLMSDLLSVFSENFGEKWPCQNKLDLIRNLMHMHWICAVTFSISFLDTKVVLLLLLCNVIDIMLSLVPCLYKPKCKWLLLAWSQSRATGNKVGALRNEVNQHKYMLDAMYDSRDCYNFEIYVAMCFRNAAQFLWIITSMMCIVVTDHLSVVAKYLLP